MRIDVLVGLIAVFIIGLMLGAGLYLYIIVPNFRGAQVRVLEKILKRSGPIIPDGETHEFFIQHRKQEAPKLSITDARLKDVSDERSLEFLEPGEKAIIVVTVKNTGGIAKDVKITWSPWSPKKLPNGLRLTHPSEKQISELKEGVSKEYKISVTVENNMKTQEIHLNLYPSRKGVVFKNNSYRFKLWIKKPLSN